ncbi:minor capsid protein [Carnobacterium maltaromaticum]|uniref:minor capsid protein n=1 Tax=Carnobacterium maltaromaticum TaxID=2751 RepID=UPI00107334AF|nr:minor capsid protein [Carnobacterium maltaromaticum]MDT1944333.1 minor capsid protein [Carnobacterium maltaromaticum]MDT1997945.1 minor capsid protein [Carnobacterium maltaromaticum]TFJ56876.1 hypothetical protein CKN96_10510 [Carnobacterium maltaromaticum]
MDFYESLSKFLTDNLVLTSINDRILFEPSFNNDKDISILDAPSSNDSRYYNTDTTYHLVVQILVKNTNQHTAYQESMQIYQLLDMLPVVKNGKLLTIKSENSSFIFNSSEGYTLPRKIEKTEHDAYIYSMLIKASILIKK